MSTILKKVPKDTLILACDARKALLISNSGSPIHPKLHVEKHFEAEEKSEEVSGDGRTGRRYDGGGTGGSFRARSAMEVKDPDIDRAAGFASQILAELSAYQHASRISQLVVVAPPAFLGLLRGKFDNQLKSMILSDIPKNVVDMPIEELQRTLIDEW